MTATRLAFSSALVLILSAFVCNAQEAPSDGRTYKVANIIAGDRSAACMMDDELSQGEINRLGNQQLSCVDIRQAYSMIDCVFKGDTCESLQNICNDLNGKVILSESCEEIVV